MTDFCKSILETKLHELTKAHEQHLRMINHYTDAANNVQDKIKDILTSLHKLEGAAVDDRK